MTIAVSAMVSLLAAAAVVPVVMTVKRSNAATHAPATGTRVAPDASIKAEGRVVTYPGHQATLGSETLGTVAAIHVKEGDRVKKGDVLAELRRTDQKAALEEAWARVGEADAQVTFLDREERRTRALVAASAIAPQAGERAREERNTARARRRAAGAAAKRIAADLAKAKIVAPIDGTVITRSVEVGETIAPGTSLLAVADLSALRVEAEIDEFDAMRVTKGAATTITVDGLPDARFIGEVEEIPDVVVVRRLRPQDPARPTDARVLLVKIKLPSGTPLKLGQRVNVTVALGPTVGASS